MRYLISMLGLGLLLVFVTSLAESSFRSSLANSTDIIGGGGGGDGGNDLQKNASCLILCNYCGCDGSFVGDDCVCDCGIDGEEHVQCLAKLEQQGGFEMIEDDESFDVVGFGAGGRRFRRDVDDVVDRQGPGRKLNRKNKRKKVNRRGRGRRFLQMLTSGPNKNRE